MKKTRWTLLAVTLIAPFAYSEPEPENSQGEGFLSQVDQTQNQIVDDSAKVAFFDRERTPVPVAFHTLPSGSTKPRGWILEMMEQDLHGGLVGALDELYPGIRADDIYNRHRRGGLEDVPEMGDLVLTGEAWEASIMWWNAETIGNWWDGFVRNAFLTGDPDSIAQSEAIVANLMSSQDEDGYMGIYKPNLRYQHRGSNGELWAQTTAFRMLLAYYEFTDDAHVLQAVERAVQLTMRAYGPEGRNPFELENAFGGVTHGLMLTDVCQSLFRITGNTAYRDYATYLYRAFSTYSINRAFNDLRYPFLMNAGESFSGHGAHTYEHFRSLADAYFATGYPEMKTALDNAMHKLELCLLPSGAGHGAEWIANLVSDPTETAVEFCCMLELRNSYLSMMHQTGSTALAERAERLTFNAMMGARNADGSAITYCIGDNALVLDGNHPGDDPHADSRFKFSPTHSDPAVCCTPNYGRNLPYYLDHMWAQTDVGIAAILYGPSELTTSLNNQLVTITQTTGYPLEDEIHFTIALSEPSKFTLQLRQPEGLDDMVLELPAAEKELRNGFWHLTREWKDGDQIRVRFDFTPQTEIFHNGEAYFTRGPLVYALPIPHETEVIKTYENTDFVDYYVHPTDDRHFDLRFDARHDASPTLLTGDSPMAWNGAGPSLEVNLWNRVSGEVETHQLIPMGSTTLRRVTFPAGSR